MQVVFGQLERAVLFEVLTAAANWGGSEKALFVRADVYRTLQLADFEGKKTMIFRGADVLRSFELSAEGVEHVIETFTTGVKMTFDRALAAEPCVRRLRAALDKSAPPPGHGAPNGTHEQGADT